MTVTYFVNLKDVKEACFEIVKVLPYFKKKRMTFTLITPIIAIPFFLFPFVEISLLFFVVPIAMLCVYFFSYPDGLYTILKKNRYKNSPQEIEVTFTIEKDTFSIKEASITRKISFDSIVAAVEKKDKYIVFLSPDSLDFIIIKKQPNNLSEAEIQQFNTAIKKMAF